MKSLLKYLSLAILILAPLEAQADIACFRTSSHISGSNNAVRVFKGNACPKKYSRVSKSVLGNKFGAGSSSIVGAQGDPGPVGDQGPQGIAGIKGITGAKGDTGAMGLQGVPGETGAQGPQGAPGERGPVGPRGVDGLIGFNFHGSTGANTVNAADATPDYWSIGDVDGPSTSKGNTEGEIATLFGNSCSRAQVTLFVASPPGAGRSWTANIAVRLPNGITGSLNACTITGTDRSCSGEVQPVVTFPATALMRIGIIPMGSPNPVVASWNVKCILP